MLHKANKWPNVLKSIDAIVMDAALQPALHVVYSRQFQGWIFMHLILRELVPSVQGPS